VEVSSIDAAASLLAVDDGSAVGEVRRTAAGLAGQLGFSEEDAGRLAVIVTEAANNLVQHAGGGEVILQPVGGGARRGVEALFIDRSSGITDLSKALRDGFSTSGTPGTGLGAISRIADVFDLHSVPGQGTVLLARVWPRDAPAPLEAMSGGLDFGSVCVPRRGERLCGDAWAAAAADGGVLVVVVDGLGHGPEAAAAAGEAIRIFRQRRSGDPGGLLAEIHAGLKSTRGAAAAAALLDSDRREIRYAGIGNISAAVFTGTESRSMVSHNGTVGHEMRRIQEFAYPWPAGALVIMHSDGLQTHWRLDRYEGAVARHPGVIAGLLYRDFNRGRDDVTVLGIRDTTPRAGRGQRPSGE
jgi:anti-sigma regulatory factor (Ser/Thr protein kinase)